MTDRLTHEALTKNLNTTFRIRVDDSATVETQLIEVSENKLLPRQERFEVVFRAPNEVPLGQGVRWFEHDEMGEFELFLVPISQDEKSTYYEAVFNRLRGDD